MKLSHFLWSRSGKFQLWYEKHLHHKAKAWNNSLRENTLALLSTSYRSEEHGETEMCFKFLRIWSRRGNKANYQQSFFDVMYRTCRCLLCFNNFWTTTIWKKLYHCLLNCDKLVFNRLTNSTLAQTFQFILLIGRRLRAPQMLWNVLLVFLLSFVICFKCCFSTTSKLVF